MVKSFLQIFTLSQAEAVAKLNEHCSRIGDAMKPMNVQMGESGPTQGHFQLSGKFAILTFISRCITN
jgi:hypothetical protein